MIGNLIIMTMFGCAIAALIAGAFLHVRWGEAPGLLTDYREWKKARAEREASSPKNFADYRSACKEEQRHAKYLLHSTLFWVATILWPLPIAAVVLYGVLYLPIQLVKFLFQLPKIIESAKGF
jgi:hypothetical protein